MKAILLNKQEQMMILTILILMKIFLYSRHVQGYFMSRILGNRFK